MIASNRAPFTFCSLSAHAETPQLRRRGVSCAFAESGLWTVREFHSALKVDWPRGHDATTSAHKGPYSNHPPDKDEICN